MRQPPLFVPLHPAKPGDGPERTDSLLDEGGMDRRQVLKLMAAALALGGSACSQRPADPIYAYGQMPEHGPTESPVFYASAVVREGYAHGVLVATKDGRPVKVEGHPGHPASLGATDVFAQAAVLQLWDPDRSQTVVRRLDPAEVPAEAPAMGLSSWDDFAAAWQDRQATWLAQEGRGLRILTGRITSPTLKAQLQAMLSRFPLATWHVHAALQEASVQGSLLAFGREAQPVLHVDRARLIVSMGGDPFSDGPGNVRHAADWAQARARARTAARPASPAMLFAVETAPGLFGARADERIALPPEEIERLTVRLVDRLWPEQGKPSQQADKASTFEDRLVSALRGARPGDALIVGGEQLSAQAHALIHLMNQRLGAIGQTIDYIEPVPFSSPHSLDELSSAMLAGEVDALLILDANPVYDAPAELRFEQALRAVRLSVHQGLYQDETAAHCHWHLPMSHGFEQWSDARAFDGTSTIIQPAISPLYDTRSAHELLALLAGDPIKGHEIVRRHWQSTARQTGRLAQGAAFEDFWRDCLQRGVVPGSASPFLTLKPATRPDGQPAFARRMEGALPACLVPDPALRDGTWANNAWLQELPRPFTKMTWGNALHLGPATARRLGLETGDVVRIDVVGRKGGPSMDWPVWVQAGHAESVATFPLGHGRWRAGSVGTGVGVNAFTLATVDGRAAQVRLTRTGRRHDFAVTQHHLSQEGRALARTVQPGERAELDAVTAQPSLYPPVSYPTQAWGMSVDLDACIGCNACTIACQAENNIPTVGAEQVAKGREMHWIRIDAYQDEAANTVFQPVPCMHCENAPCELVCPVGATVHDSEGLNVQVYNRCVGTRFCSNNCPYKVRRFNFLQYSDEEAEPLKAMRNPDVTVRQRGVMEKCTYCVQRISLARRQSERSGQPIADGDVVTACQAACATGAIRFGDLSDPHSQVSQARNSERHYALLGELNTRPRTTYLARLAPQRLPKA